jgi:hypothetical protein
MDKYFICLANSYKHGGRCVAGIEIAFDAEGKPVIIRHPDGRPRWIRPISNDSDGSISNEIAQDIKLLSVVKLTDAVPCPDKAHVEDTKFSQMECQHGCFIPSADLMELCLDNKHQAIFYFRGKAIPAVMVERLDYSLMLIKPDKAQAYVDEEREKSKYRMKFTYYGSNYDFPITDPVFLEAFRTKPECYTDLKGIYLTLSLGQEFEGFHYKLVAAVIQTEEQLFQEKAENWFDKYERELTCLLDQKREIDDRIAALRKDLLQQMELKGEEKAVSTRFTVSYIPSKTIMQFDSKLFREENKELYVKYCKPIQKVASIVVRRNINDE